MKLIEVCRCLLAARAGARCRRPPAAAAPDDVTNADVQRLQDSIYDASRDIAQLRDARRVARVAAPGRARRRPRRGDLSEGQAPQERAGRAQRVHRPARSHRQHPRRARGDSAGGTAPPASARSTRRSGQRRSTRSHSDPNDVPVGTEFDVRLQNPLSSETAQVEDRFEATTMVDLRDERSRARPGRVGDARRRQLGEQGRPRSSARAA